MLGAFSVSTIQLLMLLLLCSLSLFTVKLPPEAASRGSATIEPLKFAIWDHTDSAELTTMTNASWTPPLQNRWGAHQAQNLASYCWSESPTLEKDATVDFCFISETSLAPLLAVLQDKTINTSQVYCSASTSCPRLWYTKSIEGERERKKEGNSISLCTRLENADSWLWARRENNRSVLAGGGEDETDVACGRNENKASGCRREKNQTDQKKRGAGELIVKGKTVLFRLDAH